jgi:thiamine pyrophosphate-dependent acetolactate synthase large subunit-like protein
MLVAAQAPVIIADRACRSQEGMKRLVELAEALNAPVVDIGGRMNFPTTHYLNRWRSHWASTARDRSVIPMPLDRRYPAPSL